MPDLNDLIRAFVAADQRVREARDEEASRRGAAAAALNQRGIELGLFADDAVHPSRVTAALKNWADAEAQHRAAAQALADAEAGLAATSEDLVAAYAEGDPEAR